MYLLCTHSTEAAEQRSEIVAELKQSRKALQELQDQYDEQVNGNVTVARVRIRMLVIVCPAAGNHHFKSASLVKQVKTKDQQRNAVLKQERLHVQEVAQLQRSAHNMQVSTSDTGKIAC
jgi:hypothetical protein